MASTINQKPPDVFRIVGLIFAGLGTIFLAIALGFLWHDQQISKHSLHINGKVSRLEFDNEGMAAPVIEYRINGKKKFYIGTVWSKPPSYDEGETVKLLVNNQDENEVILDEFFDRYFIVGLFGFLGLIFGTIGVLLWVFRDK